MSGSEQSSKKSKVHKNSTPSRKATARFGEVLNSLDVTSFEVCRYFVAALQLVNNGSLDIIPKEPGRIDPDPQFKILSLRPCVEPAPS
jgi:hypothetical protein